jgi:23S rRNA pseudouridine2605 synthase
MARGTGAKRHEADRLKHDPTEPVVLERLQKIISRAGIASRRRAEDLIVSGQVEVNGRVVTELGTKADPVHDSIRVAGRRLHLPERNIYLALNKPDSCVATLTDPAGRTTLRDCLTGVAGRVFPVGGLEYHSTGLILLTTDGDFAARLFRAMGRGLQQTFRIKVKAPLKKEEVETLERRIGPIRPARSGPNPWYEVQLAGSRQDRLRRLLLELGHPVEKVKRTAIGRVELGELESGRWRHMTEQEKRALENAFAHLPEQAGPRPKTVSWPRPKHRPGQAVGGGRGKSARSGTRGERQRPGPASPKGRAKPKRRERGRPSRRKPA